MLRWNPNKCIKSIQLGRHDCNVLHQTPKETAMLNGLGSITSHTLAFGALNRFGDKSSEASVDAHSQSSASFNHPITNALYIALLHHGVATSTQLASMQLHSMFVQNKGMQHAEHLPGLESKHKQVTLSVYKAQVHLQMVLLTADKQIFCYKQKVACARPVFVGLSALQICHLELLRPHRYSKPPVPHLRHSKYQSCAGSSTLLQQVGPTRTF